MDYTHRVFDRCFIIGQFGPTFKVFGSREMTSQIETCFQTTISCNIVQQGGAKHKGRGNLWPKCDRFLFARTKRTFLEDTQSHVAPRLGFRKLKSTLVPIIKSATVQVESLKTEWFKTCLQTKTPTTSKMLPHLLKTLSVISSKTVSPSGTIYCSLTAVRFPWFPWKSLLWSFAYSDNRFAQVAAILGLIYDHSHSQ